MLLKLLYMIQLCSIRYHIIKKNHVSIIQIIQNNIFIIDLEVSYYKYIAHYTTPYYRTLIYINYF